MERLGPNERSNVFLENPVTWVFQHESESLETVGRSLWKMQHASGINRTHFLQVLGH